jgi:hypothetical protein
MRSRSQAGRGPWRRNAGAANESKEPRRLISTMPETESHMVQGSVLAQACLCRILAGSLRRQRRRERARRGTRLQASARSHHMVGEAAALRRKRRCNIGTHTPRVGWPAKGNSRVGSNILRR